jgi:hypothetical protein
MFFGEPMHIDLMRDPASIFPTVENIDEITSLRVWYCKYKNFENIAKFQKLEELIIAGFPDETFYAFISLKRLRYLRVLHMPKLKNLQALEQLPKLESLSLATSPSWDASKRKTIVHSLHPLVGIPSLKYLELFGVCSESGDLEDLKNCKKLESAKFSQYPHQQIEEFYRTTGVRDEFLPKPTFVV